MGDEKLILYLYLSTKKINNKIVRLFREMLMLIINRYYLKGDLKGIIFFNTNDRIDQKKLFDKIKDQCINNRNDVSIGKIKRLNLKYIKLFFDNINILKKLKELTLPSNKQVKLDNLERIVVYFRYINTLKVKNTLKKYDFSNVEELVVFSDVMIYEHIFVDIFNSQGKITTTCQHGVYIPSIKTDAIDVLNIWKSNSKRALLWGQEMVDLFNKYSQGTQCFICGNPNIEPVQIKEQKNTIGIATDIPELNKYNQKMISIVEEYANENNFTVKIRLHPRDNKKNYTFNQTITTFDNDIINSEYIVAHTTTMLFTYLKYGKYVFRYDSDLPFYEIDKHLCFNDLKSFENCINDKNQEYITNLASRHIKYISAESCQKYKEYFNRVYESN